jgi:hypothetical protein
MSFTAIKLKSWNDVHGYIKRGWMYRGQREVDWTLQTTIDRLFKREKTAPDQCRLFEHRLFREFRRAYHHYSDYAPRPDEALEWFSLMQHHGAPTRLLDFTYSVYVAAYFALEDATDDCVVWALNGRWALRESINLMKRAGKDRADLLKELYEERHMQDVPSFFLNDPAVTCVCPQNPFKLNERLQIQKGVFLIPGSVAIPFEDNLRAMPNYNDKEHIVKLIIPVAYRQEALHQLYEMNISRTSLFPGLDGYARSLGVYHPGLGLKPWSDDDI